MVDTIIAKLESAELPILFIEVYCVNSDCAVRKIELHIKDYDGDFSEQLRAHPPTCPVCNSQTRLHWVRTLDEENAEQYRTARCLVNVQMYERDHPGDPCVPAGVFCDDRLPDVRGAFYAESEIAD